MKIKCEGKEWAQNNAEWLADHWPDRGFVPIKPEEFDLKKHKDEIIEHIIHCFCNDLEYEVIDRINDKGFMNVIVTASELRIFHKPAWKELLNLAASANIDINSDGEININFLFPVKKKYKNKFSKLLKV